MGKVIVDCIDFVHENYKEFNYPLIVIHGG